MYLENRNLKTDHSFYKDLSSNKFEEFLVNVWSGYVYRMR